MANRNIEVSKKNVYCDDEKKKYVSLLSFWQ